MLMANKALTAVNTAITIDKIQMLNTTKIVKFMAKIANKLTNASLIANAQVLYFLISSMLVTQTIINAI